MKNKIKKLVLIMGLLTTSLLFSQMKVGNNPTVISPSAIMELESTNKGFLPPRIALMGKLDMVTIPNPSDGLIVFNTANANSGVNTVYANNYYYWGNSKWNLMVSDDSLSSANIATVAIYKLGTSIPGFLDGILPGSKRLIPLTLVSNNIKGLIFDGASRFTFTKAGVYEMILVYEGYVPGGSCTLSSYFVDFPGTRIHNNSSHASGGVSSHGGTIQYSSSFTANTIFDVALGRGQAGNCTNGMTLIAKSTYVKITRFGEN